jgi:lipopolysaccharide assembly outer membrane protein LptD (OstA)
MGAFFVTENPSYGQKNVLELLPGTDKLDFNEKTGIHKLIGHVNFTYQGNTMYCDSAYYKEKTMEVRAYGKVHINKRDTLNLFCDSLYYNGRTEKAKLWSNVRVRDREYKLTTDTLEYNSKKGEAIYRHGGKVESILNKEVITSKVAYFYPDSKDIYFSNNVDYKGEDMTLKGDTLQYRYLQNKVYFFGPTHITTKEAILFAENGWYNVKTEEGTLRRKATILNGNNFIGGDTLEYNAPLGRYIGRGNVIYKDTTQKLEFHGDYAYASDAENSSFLTGHALGLSVQGADTLYIHADTLRSLRDTLGKLSILQGYYGVKIFRNDMQGVCDSIYYDQQLGTMQLFYDPIMWTRNNELKGDLMEVFMQDSLIDRIMITGHATALMEIDSGNYYNQLGGKDMISYFKNNELIRSDLKGNARTVFFPEDTQDTDTNVVVKRMGMNRIYARDLRVYLDSGEVRGVTYFDKPDGAFYPMNQLKKEEQFISGFVWKSALRPKSWLEMIAD